MQWLSHSKLGPTVGLSPQNREAATPLLHKELFTCVLKVSEAQLSTENPELFISKRINIEPNCKLHQIQYCTSLGP